MEILKLIFSVLSLIVEAFKSYNDPEAARLRMAAKITEDMNNDIKSFKTSIATNDAAAMAAHFEQLRGRVLQNTSAQPGSNPKRP